MYVYQFILNINNRTQLINFVETGRGDIMNEEITSPLTDEDLELVLGGKLSAADIATITTGVVIGVAGVSGIIGSIVLANSKKKKDAKKVTLPILQRVTFENGISFADNLLGDEFISMADYLGMFDKKPAEGSKK